MRQNKYETLKSLVQQIRGCRSTRHSPNFSDELTVWRVDWHPNPSDNKKLSCCWETVRRDSMPRIAEMDVEMTT